MNIIKVKYIFLIIILIFTVGFTQHSFCQSNDTTSLNYRTNYEILSDLLVKSLSKIEDRIIIAGKDKTYLLSFNIKRDAVDGESINKETILFFKSLIPQGLKNYKIISDSSLNYDHRINISYPVTNVDYSKIRTIGLIGNKTVKRICSIGYYCTFENKGADSSESFRVIRSFDDEIMIDKIPSLEDTNIRFTHASLPSESTFNKLLLPAAIILSTAAAIILFFTIRK
ncbi:hypothetical protein BH10BAC5_BH10BAC5_13920 [soil metagenome]